MRRPLYEQVRLYNLVPKARVLLDQRSGNAGRYVVYGEADIGACAEDCFAYFPSLSLPMTKIFLLAIFTNFPKYLVQMKQREQYKNYKHHFCRIKSNASHNSVMKNLNKDCCAMSLKKKKTSG